MVQPKRIVCLFLAACSQGEEKECPAARWSAVTESMNRSLLSVWGTSDNDVFMVGGGLGVPDLSSLAIHWDGTNWQELDTGARKETLWWVWGVPGTRDIWMVGEKGLILRWNGTSFTQIPSGTEATLYGVWG